jgi:BNR/Asp-box repeat.
LISDNGAKFKCIVTNSCGNVTSTEVVLTVNPPIPIAPTLISPSHNALDVSVGPTLSWSSVTNAESYTVQISNSLSFPTNQMILNVNGTSTTTNMSAILSNSTKYFWRVCAKNVSGQGPWVTDSFTTLITWTQINSGLAGCGTIHVFGGNSNNVFAGADGGLYRSQDNGANWALNLAVSSISSIAINGNKIFANEGSVKLYRSINNGDTWDTIFSSTIGADKIDCITAINSTVFLHDRSDILYSSPDNGNTWPWSKYVYLGGHIKSLCANGNSLFAATSGVYVSTDGGNTWNQCGSVANGLTAINGNLYAGGTSGISFSIDNGANWNPLGPSLSTSEYIWSIALSGNKIVATSPNSSNNFYFSPNNGIKWAAAEPMVLVNPICTISGNFILIGADAGIFRSPLP